MSRPSLYLYLDRFGLAIKASRTRTPGLCGQQCPFLVTMLLVCHHYLSPSLRESHFSMDMEIDIIPKQTSAHNWATGQRIQFLGGKKPSSYTNGRRFVVAEWPIPTINYLS
jgi:hypothetical protein